MLLKWLSWDLNLQWPVPVSPLPEVWSGLSLSVSRRLKQAWYLLFILIGSIVLQFSPNWINMFRQLIAETALWVME